MLTKSKIYNRTQELRERLNSFFKIITNSEIEFFEKLTFDDLIKLKLALSDVNNVLTLKATYSFVEWICSFFNLSDSTKKELLENIDMTKPNTNGFDIQIDSPYKIIAEIKCIVPINDGDYYGAAQRNAILDDAVKLKKGKKQLADTSSYIKFLGLIDLGDRTDKALIKLLTPAAKIRTKQEIRISRHDVVKYLEAFDNSTNKNNFDFNKVYIKKIKL